MAASCNRVAEPVGTGSGRGGAGARAIVVMSSAS